MAGGNGLIINEAGFNYGQESFLELFSHETSQDSSDNAESGSKPQYTIVILQPAPRKDDGPKGGAQVVAIIDITNLIDHPFSVSKYYVLGTPRTQWKQSIPGESQYGIPLSNSRSEVTIYGAEHEVFDVPPKKLKAVVLVKSFVSSVKQYLPTSWRGFPFLNQNLELKNYIYNNAIDAIMVRDVNGNVWSCQPIDSMIRELEQMSATMKPRYLDVRRADEMPDTSLQRCGPSNRPFEHISFKSNYPTPYRQNDHSGK